MTNDWLNALKVASSFVATVCIKSPCYYPVNKWNIFLTDIFLSNQNADLKKWASWTPSQNHSFEWETGRGERGGGHIFLTLCSKDMSAEASRRTAIFFMCENKCG